MSRNIPKKWLLLIHQIPPKPNALRVKIWRRLQQVGAVAVKQSVYAMPVSEQSREDLSWILKEIVEGGGEGSISEARFLEGLTDQQIVALFQSARKADYEKIIQEVGQLLAEGPPSPLDQAEQPAKGSAPIARLRRRLEEIAAVDFFQAPEKGTAEMLLKDLAAQWSRESTTAGGEGEALENLKGKTWVTRKNLFVDRIACGWLIRRFVDSEAVFKFAGDPHYVPGPGELRFDMFEGEFTHEGDRCSFEVMIQRLQVKDRAVTPMAEIVHDIDLKDNKYGRRETDGFQALLTGIIASHADDHRRMAEGIRLFDNLHAFFQSRREGTRRRHADAACDS